MPTRTKASLSIANRAGMIFVLACAAVSGVALGQPQNIQPQQAAHSPDDAVVHDAIAKVKSGEFSNSHVEIIVRAGALEAIPVLREQFDHSRDPLAKAKLAFGLIKLGENGEAFWDYLVRLATASVDNDAPSVWDYDDKGRTIPGLSPGFIAWAQTKRIPIEVAQEDAILNLPGAVLLLGKRVIQDQFRCFAGHLSLETIRWRVQVRSD